MNLNINYLHTKGLPNLTYMCIDANVIITSNLWKRVGITNGATSTVKSILYPPNKQFDTLPHTVVVKLNDYNGPQFFIKSFWTPEFSKS